MNTELMIDPDVGCVLCDAPVGPEDVVVVLGEGEAVPFALCGACREETQRDDE